MSENVEDQVREWVRRSALVFHPIASGRAIGYAIQPGDVRLQIAPPISPIAGVTERSALWVDAMRCRDSMRRPATGEAS